MASPSIVRSLDCSSFSGWVKPPIPAGYNSSMTYRTHLVSFCLLLLALGCQQADLIEVPDVATVTPAPVVVRLGVASSAMPLAALLEEADWEGQERSRLQFVSGPAETLYADLSAGQLDGIFVHSLPAGSSAYFTPVALDALVPLVHPDNPITNLTQAQWRALLSGQITEWAVMGGPALAVSPFSRERGSGNRQIFLERVMVELPISINAPVPGSYEMMLAALAEAPGSIGYGAMGHVGAAKPISLDGILATPSDVTTQVYPLTMPLYFVSMVEPAGSTETTTRTTAELRAFIAWLQSPGGQATIGTRYGRVD